MGNIGRPPKWDDPEAFAEKAIDEYFEKDPTMPLGQDLPCTWDLNHVKAFGNTGKKRVFPYP